MALPWVAPCLQRLREGLMLIAKTFRFHLCRVRGLGHAVVNVVFFEDIVRHVDAIRKQPR